MVRDVSPSVALEEDRFLGALDNLEGPAILNITGTEEPEWDRGESPMGSVLPFLLSLNPESTRLELGVNGEDAFPRLCRDFPCGEAVVDEEISDLVSSMMGENAGLPG